jgi:ribulose-phosphate 3-epimerase
MNIEIIPAILAKNITEVREKIKLVEPHVQWVHLDVMDGVFVPNVSWNNPDDLMRMRLPVKMEVHLMVAHPEEVYLNWILAGASRIVWHLEASGNHAEIAADVRRRGVEAGIAVNPETPVAALEPLLSLLDRALIMANTPGASGQALREETLEKIRVLRTMWPRGAIGVDIGITPETAAGVVEAGANALVSGGYIFNAPTPQEGIEALRTSVAGIM